MNSYLQRTVELLKDLDTGLETADWPKKFQPLKSKINYLKGFIEVAPMVEKEQVIDSVFKPDIAAKPTHKKAKPDQNWRKQPRNKSYECTECHHIFKSKDELLDVKCPECQSLQIIRKKNHKV